MEDQQRLVSLLERMNRLLALNLVKGMNLRDQVVTLDFSGFTPKEIAGITRKTPNHISVILYDERKKARKDGEDVPQDSPRADRGVEGQDRPAEEHPL